MYGYQGGRRGWGDLGDGVDIYILLILYIKLTTNENILYTQGTLLNAPWRPKWEGNPKKRDICICIADSFCYTVETNTTL